MQLNNASRHILVVSGLGGGGGGTERNRQRFDGSSNDFDMGLHRVPYFCRLAAAADGGISGYA